MMASVLASPARSVPPTDCPAGCSDLTTIAKSVSEITGTWYVIQCRPRYERRVESDIALRGLDAYLPLVRRRQWYPETPTTHAGYRVSEIPAFSRYLFAAVNDEPGDWTSYYRLRSVANCQIIPVQNQPKLRREILSIEQAINLNPSMQIRLHLAVGQLCTIKSGPFEGQSGNIVKIQDGKHTVALRIETLGQAVDVELDQSEIELIC